MYPGLKPEQAAVVARAAELSRGELAKRAEQYDRDGKFPLENYAALHKAGLLGLTVPKEYGGVGADWLTYALTLLEMGKGCSATALTFNMHCVILDFITHLGTEEQKRRWFGEVVNHGKLFASITSEPQASFRHKFVLTTTFKPVDGGFLLNGVKHFGSLGEHSSYHFVTALIEGTTSAKDGQQSALVPAPGPGISVERNWDAVGMRATSSDTIKYDNCFVRREDCLGGIAALSTIDITGFALGYSAIYLGIGEAAFDYVLQYAKQQSFGLPEPLSHHPSTQRAIGEMAVAIRGARALLCEAAQVKMQGDRRETTLAVNESKCMSADVGFMVTDRAIRLAGGRGILRKYPLERWHRDAMCGPVMAPANDRCLETAGKILCGLEGKTLEYV
jgi:alkylation response protein AidB-like acyl-CoA dehydrogenase